MKTRAFEEFLESTYEENQSALTVHKISLTPENIHTLFQWLEDHPSIVTLSLCYSSIAAKTLAKAFAESLKKNSTLIQLNFPNNDIDADALAESLKESLTLTQLDLNNNNIGDKGAAAFADLLKKNSNLTRLGLNDNSISPEGAGALAESLKENTTLTQLELWHNNIGDKGTATLAGSLKENSTLTLLDLWENNIGDEGAKALAESLKENSTLTQLYLSSNNIGDVGAEALINLLKANSTITELDLDHNNINQDLLNTIDKQLERNKRYKAMHTAAVFCVGFSLAFDLKNYMHSISGKDKVLPDDVVMHIIELYLEQASLFEHDMPSNQSKVSPEFSLAENIFEKVKVILNNRSPIAKLDGKESNAAQQEGTVDRRQSIQSQPDTGSTASGRQAALMNKIGTFSSITNKAGTSEQQPAAHQHLSIRAQLKHAILRLIR